ncbi:hypothetical protein N0V95_004650 [Ascochyta clinopodiicola]|nr:hypothetical protein N0V95_004650 [Ascochyta clinopodiicola]
MGTGFAQNMASLLVLRFFAGFFAAPSLSMGSGTLSDLWQPEKRSGPMSLYVAAPFFGPAIGPLLGAAVTQTVGWRWTSWLILFFSIVLVFLPAPFYWESYKPILLRRRAKKNGQPIPPSPLEGVTCAKALHTYISKTLTRPIHMLLTEPIVAVFNTYSAFNFGLLYAFFAAFPQVYFEYYGFNSLSTGLTFLGVGAGVIAGTIVIILFSKKWYLPHVHDAVANDRPAPSFATSRLAPEERLPLAMVGGPCITVGLFMYGWTTAYRVHWIAPTIAEGLFGFGNMLVFMACMMYITDTYGPLYSASAMASNAILRYVLGGTFPLFAVQMFPFSPVTILAVALPQLSTCTFDPIKDEYVCATTLDPYVVAIASLDTNTALVDAAAAKRGEEGPLKCTRERQGSAYKIGQWELDNRCASG